jgi:hypothetical protein
MLTLSFCLGDNPPELRYSAYRPQIGDTVWLSELGRNLGPVTVVDVSECGVDKPQVDIRVHKRRHEHDKILHGARRRIFPRADSLGSGGDI